MAREACQSLGFAHEADDRALRGTGEPRVTENLINRGTFQRIHTHQAAHQVDAGGAHTSLTQDIHHHFHNHALLFQVVAWAFHREITGQHHIESGAQTPGVHLVGLEGVAQLDFRRGIGVSSTLAGKLGVQSAGRVAEITQEGVVVLIEENIVGLDIEMGKVLFMALLDTQTHIVEDFLASLLGDRSETGNFLQDVGFHQVHHQVPALTVNEIIVDTETMLGALEFRVEIDFAPEGVEQLCRISFHRHLLVGGEGDSGEHSTLSPLEESRRVHLVRVYDRHRGRGDIKGKIDEIK